MMKLTEKEIIELFDSKRIRPQCQKIFDLTLQGKTQFKLNLDKLKPCADFVIETIYKNYPDLNIPYHSRWGHFRAGGVDRNELLNKTLKNLPIVEKTKAKLDLAIVSVLLDAGAGMEWSYSDCKQKYSKSEGLAVASFNMFMKGSFSSDANNPARVDADKLKKLTTDDLTVGFQVSPSNPLIGVEGRLAILKKLGEALQNPIFKGNIRRPGNLVSALPQKTMNLPANEVLKTVLLGLNSIWPKRIASVEQNLGDVWHHPLLGEKLSMDSLVPFHKLSQWLSYSLLEPLEEFGFTITDLNSLTGLPEYRNGGLFIDMQVIEPKNKQDFECEHTADSLFIIEWRALTVILLDQIAKLICEKLNKTPEAFPLVKVLEGGTWWAGRRIAKDKRSDGGPPFKIVSDGTVF